MAIKLNKKNSNIRRRLALRILTRFITALVIFSAVLFGLFFLGALICSSVIWQGNEPWYPLLHFISENRKIVLIFIWIVGFIVIFIRYWSKTLGYLEDIIQATKSIYNNKDKMIELPSDLNDVETQMNQIRYSFIENINVAKEAEQRKNDLVVYLAHDLKTPLTSVIGYLTLLQDEKQISEELRDKYISISLNKAERLEDLINEFFEITRFNLSNLTLEFSQINLTRMLEQIIFEFKPILSEKGLQCVLNSPPNIMIKCDVNKMQRVFDNLLRNAVNYSFENSTIEVNIAQSIDSITLTFKNKGNTIPEEKLNRIFEQFYRLDTGRTTKTGGAGLGLAIAKQIIELHKGTISAFSKDEIITFEVTIPTL